MVNITIELSEQDAALLYEAWSNPDFLDPSDEVRVKRWEQTYDRLMRMVHEKIGAALLAN